MIQSQSYAIDIEHVLCSIFSCERNDIGGIVDSDHIRKYPIASMIHGMTYLYANAGQLQRKSIESFIADVSFYSQWSIDELFSFKSKSKVIDGAEYILECESGKQQLESIIKKFKEITHM